MDGKNARSAKSGANWKNGKTARRSLTESTPIPKIFGNRNGRNRSGGRAPDATGHNSCLVAAHPWEPRWPIRQTPRNLVPIGKSSLRFPFIAVVLQFRRKDG